MLSWSSDFESGHTGIDDQHKKIFEITEGLTLAIRSRDNDFGTMLDLLTELDDYVHVHFRYEEGLIEKYNYPDPARSMHIDDHYAFTMKVNTFNTSQIPEEQRIEFLKDMLSFVIEWLSLHIIQTDRLLGGFVATAKEAIAK